MRHGPLFWLLAICLAPVIIPVLVLKYLLNV